MQSHWGPWSIDVGARALVYADSDGNGYRVNLNKCTNGETTLTEIMLVAGRRWGNADVVGQLVFALDEASGGLLSTAIGAHEGYSIGRSLDENYPA